MPLIITSAARAIAGQPAGVTAGELRGLRVQVELIILLLY